MPARIATRQRLFPQRNLVSLSHPKLEWVIGEHPHDIFPQFFHFRGLLTLCSDLSQTWLNTTLWEKSLSTLFTLHIGGEVCISEYPAHSGAILLLSALHDHHFPHYITRGL